MRKIIQAIFGKKKNPAPVKMAATVDIKNETISISKKDYHSLPNDRRNAIMLHEEAYIAMQENAKKFQPPLPPNETEYFDNFPFKEELVRLFLKCMQKIGYFSNVDSAKEPISNILSHPKGDRGFRIMNITEGPGTHNTMMWGESSPHEMLDCNYEVKEGEVYVTYSNIGFLSGATCTCIIIKNGEESRISRTITHRLS